jgi:peptidoglycan/xylan/chitin deacetylase (PgdA/CDA1 family)
MTPEDLEQLREVAASMVRGFDRIGVLSPTVEGPLFPRATKLSRRRWDLNEAGSRRYDLLVAANVFMYSPAPDRWFRHVLSACKYFLMLDIVRRRRGSNSEFGGDGDQMRYALGEARPRVSKYFDLASLGDNRLLGYRIYPGGPNAQDDDPLHVIALFRGDLADPILRVDDYPTGIRPLLADLSPIQRIIEKIDRRGLPFHLGIVPALLTQEMVGFLRSLDHIIPAAHGYDHAYPRFAPVLRASNDPYNEATVGAFDEFQGAPYSAILEKIRTGRELLEDRLSREVRGYIPPGNRGNRATGRALPEAGYHYYLSEKRIRACRLPAIKSDFYGRSEDFDFARSTEVTTLHCTWEWDVSRRKGDRALDRLLDHIVARREEARQRGSQLGALLRRS